MILTQYTLRNAPIIAILTIFGIPTSAVGAIHCIRAGATGAPPCADWTNACGSLPTNLARGDTYYMAAGSYGGHTFSDSGSALITVKRATGSDHGTATGWSPSYDGLVTFTGRLVFAGSFYTLDGQTRTNITTGHGFLIDIAQFSGAPACNTWGTCDGVVFDNSQDVGNITLRYVEIKSTGQGATGSSFALFGDRGTSTHIFGPFTFSYVSLHDFPSGSGTGMGGSGQIQSAGWTNVTLEHSYIARNRNAADAHSEAWADTGSSNVTIRYNVIADIDGTGYLVTGMSGNPVADNWLIYGNIFMVTSGNPYNVAVGNGIISCLAGACTNWSIYNNTIVNMGSPNLSSGVFIEASGPNSVSVENNLWYNSVIANQIRVTTADYNSYLMTPTNDTGPHRVQDNTLLNPFVNLTSGDFHLASNNPDWSNWLPLTSPFNVDPDGVARISSRGAYQYTSGGGGGSGAPPAPGRPSLSPF